MMKPTRCIKSEGGVGDRRAIVLGRPGWHAGVIGIVAGRLAESFHRPVVIVSLGTEIAQGSARSIPGFDLYEAIKDCSEGLLAYGGHAGRRRPQAQCRTLSNLCSPVCRTV